jgi:hypothetical protein
MAPLVIASRFCGPPDSGNHGYVCGLVAARLGGQAEVTLPARPAMSATRLSVGFPGSAGPASGFPAQEAVSKKRSARYCSSMASSTHRDPRRPVTAGGTYHKRPTV